MLTHHIHIPYHASHHSNPLHKTRVDSTPHHTSITLSHSSQTWNPFRRKPLEYTEPLRAEPREPGPAELEEEEALEVEDEEEEEEEVLPVTRQC